MAVPEEFVILVVATSAGSELREVPDKLNATEPPDLLEAVL